MGIIINVNYVLFIRVLKGFVEIIGLFLVEILIRLFFLIRGRNVGK